MNTEIPNPEETRRVMRHLCDHLDVRQQMHLRATLLWNRDEASLSPNAAQASDFNFLAALCAECAMQDDEEQCGELEKAMRAHVAEGDGI